MTARQPKPAAAWAGLATTWDRRARLAADWLQAETAVADIGCGLMSLEAFLPPGTAYVPMDVVPRDARTLLVDLARDRIPAVGCSAAVLLGVLEYVEDVAAVLRQLGGFPKSVISYNHRSVHDLLWQLRLRPKRVDWRHRYSQRRFRRLLRAAGLTIVRQRPVRLGEALYEVRPAGQAAAPRQSPP